MIWRLALVFWLCLAAAVLGGQTYMPLTGAGSQPAAVGGITLAHKNLAQNAGSGSSRATTLATTTAGNFIVVGIAWCQNASCNANSGQTVSTVTSSNSGSGETCSQVASAGSLTGNVTTDVWYCPNIVGGSDTITATLSGSPSYLVVSLSEWSGVNSSSPIDAVANHSTSNSAASSSVTTSANVAQSGELIYSVVLNGNSANITQGGSQTPITNTGAGFLDSYQLTSSITTYTNTASWTGSTGQGTSLGAFKHP